MKHLFRIGCLLFITVSSIYGQKIEFINKTFEVDEETIVELDLKNINFNIETSPDDKIYLNLSAVLHNYKNKDIEKYRERVKVNASKSYNIVKIAGHGSYWSDIHKFYLTSDLIPELGKRIEKDTSNRKKSKKEILEEINLDVYGNVEGKNLEKKSIDNKKRYRKIRISKERFVLKIPSHIRLRIKGENANFLLKENKNPTELNIKRGGLLARSLTNPKNKIYVKDAYFKVGTINGGELGLNDVHTGLIGELKNTTISSSFSKIEIGEIQENNKITDVNGTYWYYNFTKDFSNFKLDSDYSKLYLFFPITDFSFKVYGNNTISYAGEHKIIMQSKNEKTNTLMMEHRAKNLKLSSGEINFHITNGVIYTMNDKFFPNKD